MKRRMKVAPRLTRWMVGRVAEVLSCEEYGLEAAGRDAAACLLARVAGEVKVYGERAEEPRTEAERGAFWRGLLAASEAGVAFFFQDKDGPVLKEEGSSNPDVYAVAVLVVAHVVTVLLRSGEVELARQLYGVVRGLAKQETRLRRLAEGL